MPFKQLQRGQLLVGGREYAAEAIGAAMVTPFGLGGLMMAKKRQVDVLVFDYRNDKGGLMGVVLQLPKGEGTRCKQWLERFGAKVEEPPATPASPVKHGRD